MGNVVGRICGGQSNLLLSLNDTCQRLRCLMACCGGHVNVTTKREGDCTDAAVQTDDAYHETTTKEETSV